MNFPARMVTRALGVIVALGIAGCGVGSISPFVSDADIHMEPRLLGVWGDSAAGGESAVISASGPQHYAIVYTDSDGKIGRFWGVLGPATHPRLLDLEPQLPDSDASGAYASLLVPLHGAVFIEAIDPELRYRILNADTLRSYLRLNPGAIAHVMRTDDVILTAPTAELQTFLENYVRRPEALDEAHVWVRRAP